MYYSLERKINMSKFWTFVAKRWKAVVPLVVYGLSEAAKHGFDLNSPTGVKAFVWAAITAIVVHQVPNRTKQADG